MIKRIDQMLKLWAQELHGDGAQGQGRPCGSNMIAMLMESGGQLIRGTRGSRVLLDQSADIELIVAKHMPRLLAHVVYEHYCNDTSLLSQKLLHCGCSSRTYYQRLHAAHEFVERLLAGH